MLINQLSVFVQNEKGRLAEITTVLKENSIDIRALCIADTTDFGILRLIVDNPELANKVLSSNGFTVSLTKVIAIGVEDRPGGLSEALHILNDKDISVEYMYAFIGREESKAFVIIRVEDNDAAVKVLSDNNIRILTCEDVYKF